MARLKSCPDASCFTNYNFHREANQQLAILEPAESGIHGGGDIMARQKRPQLMGHVLVEQHSHGCSTGLWEWPYARMRRIVSDERFGKLSRVSSTVAPNSSSVRIVSAGMRVPLTTGFPPTFPATLSTRSHSNQSTVMFSSAASFMLDGALPRVNRQRIEFRRMWAGGPSIRSKGHPPCERGWQLPEWMRDLNTGGSISPVPKSEGSPPHGRRPVRGDPGPGAPST